MLLFPFGCPGMAGQLPRRVGDVYPLMLLLLLWRGIADNLWALR